MSQHLLNLAHFTEKDLIELIDLAHSFQTQDPPGYRYENIFPDKKVASIFCEPSTRTKLSFEIATHNLGAQYIDFNLANSSIQKGETLEDTVEAMMLMGVDLCVLRHTDSSIHTLANKFPALQFVNAGEGAVSHPSQALLDLMTIRESKKSFDDLKITIVGDLDHSRVVSSFLEAIQIVGYKTITFCGHPDLCILNGVGIRMAILTRLFSQA